MLSQRYLLEICLGVTDLKFNEDLSISVVVPFYNRSRFLKRLLDSVAAQTLAVDKVYIIDNGSNLAETVKAWEIITTHKLMDKCVFTSSIGKGNANFARNLGYELAKTKYVAFLDSDDWWNKEHLASSIHSLKKSNKVAVYSGAIVHNNSGYKIKKSVDVNVFDNPFSLIMSSEGYLAQTSSYIVDKSKLGFEVVWDESLKRHQDFDYFASVFYSTSGWCFCSDINVYIDWDQGGTKKDLDFASLILFYNKWQDKIPNIIKKSYLFEMLCLCYKLEASYQVKSFYYDKISDLHFFNDRVYRVKCSKLYLIPYKTLYSTLISTGLMGFVRSILKK